MSRQFLPAAIAGALATLFAATVSAAPTLSGCPVFPADHIWNVPVDTLPVHARSNDYVNAIGATATAHPDFGAGLWEGAPIGIPYISVDSSQPGVNVTFEYADESDGGPYPVPANPPIEGGPQSSGDRHILMVDRDRCRLYELYAAYPNGDGSWRAGSGAIYDLRGYGLRPAGWTSADAAGLPVLAGLARYDEVAAGEITHALRFTVPRTQKAYVWPARHYASSRTETNLPPMGLRMRLKASVDENSYTGQAKVIVRALKKYGMLLADNGSAWYLSGAPDDRWNNTDLRQLKRLRGSDFEAVDTSSLQLSADSGQARSSGGSVAPASGWWWNPAESGRGYVIEKQGNRAFFAAYLYDTAGAATWTVAWCNETSAAAGGWSCSGALETYRGGQAIGGTYRAPTRDATGPGTMSLSFSASDRGTLSWPGGTVPIQRFEYVPGSTATPHSDTGWWWNAAESGRGWALEVQGDVLLAGGYMYRGDTGSPVWYLGVLQRDAATGAYRGNLQEYGGGQSMTGAYRAPAVANGAVAAAEFTPGLNGAGTMKINGNAGPLTRFGF